VILPLLLNVSADQTHGGHGTIPQLPTLAIRRHSLGTEPGWHCFSALEGQEEINIVLQMISNATQAQCPASGVGSLGSAVGGIVPCRHGLVRAHVQQQRHITHYYTDQCNSQRTPDFFYTGQLNAKSETFQQAYINAVAALVGNTQIL